MKQSLIILLVFLTLTAPSGAEDITPVLAGDNSGYFALQLDHNDQVIDSKGYVTYVCDERGNFFDPHYTRDRGQRYTVVEGHYATPEDRRVIGPFFIKDAAINVETRWPDMAP
ncbi:MAG: hypothetical protein ACJ04O_11345 [Cellvibrionales bacterium]|nr:hypothetical protein [Porticoccaceae bacterium]|tara:strand:+ start:6049 stop:6387 length:339 start_codon:yes stop_codon:yes gene_type:complete